VLPTIYLPFSDTMATAGRTLSDALAAAHKAKDIADSAAALAYANTMAPLLVTLAEAFSAAGVTRTTSIASAAIDYAKANADAAVAFVGAIAGPGIAYATALAEANKTFAITSAEISKDENVAAAEAEKDRISALAASDPEFDYYYTASGYYGGGGGGEGWGDWFTSWGEGSFYRWLWTGDYSASDATYRVALNFGGTVLAEQWFAPIDGFVPLVAPYSSYYDGTLDRTQWSQLAGAGLREALLLWTGTKVASAIMGPERWLAASFLDKAMFRNLYLGVLVESTLPRSASLLYDATSVAQLIGSGVSYYDTYQKIRGLIAY